VATQSIAGVSAPYAEAFARPGVAIRAFHADRTGLFSA
jgi:hypothetical protein